MICVSGLVRFISFLSPKEQRYALKVASHLRDLFEELRKQGYLRTKLREGEERTNFIKILRESDNLFGSYNMLFLIFEEKEKSKEFIRHNEKFGLYDTGMEYLILSESISTFQRSVELFKNCFLFILKTRKDFKAKITIDQFLQMLVKVAGTKGKTIAREIDVDLRNGLARGLFWMDGTELVYCEDITLKKTRRIGLDTMWIKARKQSIVSQCLIKLIPDWFSGML